MMRWNKVEREKNYKRIRITRNVDRSNAVLLTVVFIYFWGFLLRKRRQQQPSLYLLLLVLHTWFTHVTSNITRVVVSREIMYICRGFTSGQVVQRYHSIYLYFACPLLSSSRRMTMGSELTASMRELFSDPN